MPAQTLLGASFSDYVQKQIKLRQEKLSLSQARDDQWLLWKNSNTAFVRLASSIDVNNDVGAMAQKYPLFNTKFNGSLASGVGLGGNTAYGWESSATDGYGFVPPPGIISAEIKAQNRGSLREATIEIRCYSKQQFEIISKLYLRLGFSMALEWGWSYYYDSAGVWHENFNTLFTSTFLFSSTSTPESILNQIKTDQNSSGGNYDAIIGVVSNYSWNLEKDGSFKITLNLKTWGDITESLKSNSSTDNDPNKQVDPNAPSLTTLDKSANKSDLNKILFNLANYLFANNLPKKDAVDNAFITNLTGLKPSQNSAPYGTATGEIIQLTFPKFENGTTGGKGLQNAAGSQQQYIKLGALLRIMQNYILMYNTASPNSNALVNVYPAGGNAGVDLSIPCFKLDSEVSISLDPRVCIIPFANISFVGTIAGVKTPTTGAPGIQQFLDSNSSFRSSGYKYIGLAEEIYISIGHIAKVLDSYIIRETGAVSVYDFLQNLMKDVQNALGNINNFEVIYSEEDNEIRIIDSTVIPEIEKFASIVSFTPSTPFILSTLDQANGSFLRDAKIQSKLSNAFASQTTIGAQANGNVVGADATMLSKFNDGLVDRLVEEKNNKNTTSVTTTLQNSRHIRINYQLETDYGTITPEFIDSFKQPMIDWFRLYVNYLVNKDEIPPVGLLPIDLEVTMDGLSGIKIYENYFIDGRLLPEDYKDSVRFITTGVSHKIQGNDWTTTLNSVLSPINKNAVPTPSKASGTIGTSNRNTNSQPNTNQIPNQNQTPNSTPNVILNPNKCGKYDFASFSYYDDINKVTRYAYNYFPSTGKSNREYVKLSQEQLTNLRLIDETLIKYGFESVESRIGVLSVIGKESGYRPTNEQGWGYSKNKIIEKWGGYFKEGGNPNHPPADQYWTPAYNKNGKRYNANYEPQIPNGKKPWEMENTAAHLFGYIYSHTLNKKVFPPTVTLGRYDNQTLEDGWVYRGRGFHGITFKSGYKKISKALDKNLMNYKPPTNDFTKDPDKANDPQTSAIVVAVYCGGPNSPSQVWDMKKNISYGYKQLLQNKKGTTTEQPGDKEFWQGTDIYCLVWCFARATAGYGDQTSWGRWSEVVPHRNAALRWTDFLINLYENDSVLQQRSNGWKYCAVPPPAPAPAPIITGSVITPTINTSSLLTPLPTPVTASAPAPTPVTASAPAPTPVTASAPAPTPVTASAPAPAPVQPSYNTGNPKRAQTADGDYVVGTKDTGFAKSSNREIAERKWQNKNYNYTPAPGSPLLQ